MPLTVLRKHLEMGLAAAAGARGQSKLFEPLYQPAAVNSSPIARDRVEEKSTGSIPATWCQKYLGFAEA